MKIFKLSLFLMFLSVLYSCNSLKSFGGKYRSYAYSNKNTIFYNIELDFKPDSTFDYRMNFDIYGDHATGHYNIKKHYINLYYDVDKIDSSITTFLSSRNKNGRMSCLYFENNYNKLYNCDSTGKVFKVYPDGSTYFFKKGTFD